MTKRLYIIGRRHGPYAAGDQVLLTEEEAQALDNEAPGVLERIIPLEVEREQDRVHGEGRAGNRPAKPAVKGDV